MNDEIREILVLQNYVSRYKSDEKTIINHRLTTALMLDYLEVKNLLQFDAWASTFGETVTAIELAPERNRLQSKNKIC